HDHPRADSITKVDEVAEAAKALGQRLMPHALVQCGVAGLVLEDVGGGALVLQVRIFGARLVAEVEEYLDVVVEEPSDMGYRLTDRPCRLGDLATLKEDDVYARIANPAARLDEIVLVEHENLVDFGVVPTHRAKIAVDTAKVGDLGDAAQDDPVSECRPAQAATFFEQLSLSAAAHPQKVHHLTPG